MAPDSTHIVCFGNELHGDDGFGPAVYEHLLAIGLPSGTRLFRADVSGISATRCFEACDRAIVIDALRGYGTPGSLHQLDGGLATVEAPAGSHGAGVGALLELLPAMLPCPPRITIIGTEIERAQSFSPGLSTTVAATVPRVADLALQLVRNG